MDRARRVGSQGAVASETKVIVMCSDDQDLVGQGPVGAREQGRDVPGLGRTRLYGGSERGGRAGLGRPSNPVGSFTADGGDRNAKGRSRLLEQAGKLLPFAHEHQEAEGPAPRRHRGLEVGIGLQGPAGAGFEVPIFDDDDAVLQCEHGISVVRVARPVDAVPPVDQGYGDDIGCRVSKRDPVEFDGVAGLVDQELVAGYQGRARTNVEALEVAAARSGTLESEVLEPAGDVICGTTSSPGADLAALQGVVRQITNMCQGTGGRPCATLCLGAVLGHLARYEAGGARQSESTRERREEGE